MQLRTVRTIGPAGALVALLTGASAACGQMATSAGDAVVHAAESITADNLQRHLEVIAHDSMLGRDTPSRGLLLTARYVAQRFRDYGLEPGAGEDYVQLYPLSRIRPADADRQSLRFTRGGETTDLDYGAGYFVQAGSARAEAAGDLVLVERAADMPAASGRIAVLRVTTANLREVFGGRLREAIRAARPAGLVVVMDLPASRFDRFREFLGGERMVYGEIEAEGAPVVYVSQSALPDDLTQALVAGSLPAGWTAELATTAHLTVDEAPNTIAVLRGSDPELRDEYVLLTAHMDHVGVGRSVQGDSIYNGADDDGSGTVTVVELARAFAGLRTPPRRSIIFLVVSGEERGLLGSRYYAENPTFPLENTVANINLDMVGRNWSDTIAVIGKDESTLGLLVERVSAEHPELDMAVIGDLWPEESFYTRSDHYNFARRGVPILFYFNGTHADYHLPSDEVEKIDYDKMARIGRLIFHLTLAVANGDERPAWDPEAYERVVDRPRS